MNIHRIVVGTDFSQSAAHAVDTAMQLARHSDAELVLVHVGPVAEHLAAELPVGTYERHMRDWVESVYAQRRKDLAELRERLSGQGVVVSQAIHEGYPPRALTDAAVELDADLIVIGSYGRSSMPHLKLGNVAEKVLRMAATSILVSRTSRPAGGFSRILVPLDLGDLCDRVIETAVAVAADGAQLELFHCWELPETFRRVQHGPEGIDELRNAKVERVDDELNRLLLEHRHAGVDLRFEQDEIGPRAGIARRLDSKPYDLVVVGSHGAGENPWPVGSVADWTARNAGCSVLVVKQGDVEP